MQNHIPAVVVTISRKQLPMQTFASGVIAMNTNDPVSANNLFQIGSITKTFTAAEILLLESDGKLSINAPIGQWFPEYPKWKNITLKQLLNMSSGVYNYMEDDYFIQTVKKHPDQNWQPHELTDIAYKHADYFKPGSGWHYNNTGYILAGEIIEKITKQSASAILNQKLLSPYHLSNTYYTPTSLSGILLSRMANGYQGTTNTIRFNLSSIGTAGAMISNTQDIATWTRLLFTKVLPPQQMTEFLTTYNYGHHSYPAEPNGSAFGLGIFSFKTTRLGKIWWYTGVTAGYSALLVWIPEKQEAITVTINRIPGKYYRYLLPDKALFNYLITHEV